MTYKFYSDCVGWPSNDVRNEGGLSDMIGDAATITRRTFIQHIDREELAQMERSLSYETHHKLGLTMAADWHVSYHRSTLHGRRVYYFRHSAIEYVFTRRP